MVDLTSRLEAIRKMIDEGKYFTINRPRQYGKTTILRALEKYLAQDYLVISLDFQKIGDASFATEGDFVQAFARLLVNRNEFGHLSIQADILRELEEIGEREARLVRLDHLFLIFSRWCRASAKRIVMFIDEVDSATNNQVFLDFLAQLRGGYIDRDVIPAFWSVILAGVTDIRNLKRKLRPEETRRMNSPWNIAAHFNVIMSFSVEDIVGMLKEYEEDHHTRMNVEMIARIISDYTGGYPILVSRICEIVDTELAASSRFGSISSAWSREGIDEAAGHIVMERNSLFGSLIGKVYDDPDLGKVLRSILFAGDCVAYNPDRLALEDAEMYGFIRSDNGKVRISNRIFETRLYNYFLGEAEGSGSDSQIYKAGAIRKNFFTSGGHLDMEQILERYVVCFDEIYGERYERFDEAEGRRRFLLFIRPIINGTGNYYIEAETRNNERMDLVIDYLGERSVIELKIWRGNAYRERGERQLSSYLEYYHLKKGYMLSYNFNQNKERGVHHILVGDKELVEAVV